MSDVGLPPQVISPPSPTMSDVGLPPQVISPTMWDVVPSPQRSQAEEVFMEDLMIPPPPAFVSSPEAEKTQNISKVRNAVHKSNDYLIDKFHHSK
jgi:hypothetical protein